jgi:hypothetical protein
MIGTWWLVSYANPTSEIANVTRPMLTADELYKGNTDKSLEARRLLKAQFHKMTTNSEHY